MQSVFICRNPARRYVASNRLRPCDEQSVFILPETLPGDVSTRALGGHLAGRVLDFFRHLAHSAGEQLPENASNRLTRRITARRPNDMKRLFAGDRKRGEVATTLATVPVSPIVRLGPVETERRREAAWPNHGWSAGFAGA